MEEIKRFFSSLNLPAFSYQRNVAGFERNPDIAAEFEHWLKTGKYTEADPVKVEGYSAYDICQLAPFLDGAGAFNFLITLREKPEKAKQYIAEGFKIK